MGSVLPWLYGLPAGFLAGWVVRKLFHGKTSSDGG